ncbi:DUF6923 family protein [Corynebacterium segmentosum]|uniref:Surface-anchored protein fimbrial subunit n=1 Tax=Corynebacterium segmentosum TaxID=43990 RepID=A0ABY6THD1_9CORY|nr:SpaA isopeptide-forming pilin-related protein [Corynebacterium segmentosum]VEH73757.1 surface-anchored protein fimbrial subunit [Corynebacterium segmentosum]
MSWSKLYAAQSGWRRYRGVAPLIATLTLIFSLIALAALPTIASPVAAAQTSQLGTALDSPEPLNIADNNTAVFEGHFTDDGTVNELEFSAINSGNYELGNGDYTLKIDGKDVPVREGQNLSTHISSGLITIRIAQLDTRVSAGTTYSLETPPIEGESTLNGISVTANGTIAENAPEAEAAPREDATEDSHTVPEETGETESAPQIMPRSVAPYAANSGASEKRTFTIKPQAYEKNAGHQSFLVPVFQIPQKELANGAITLPKGTEVLLEVNNPIFQNSHPNDQKISYTGKNGGWSEAPATYEKINDKKYRVTLPATITIGGNAEIQFTGVRRGRPTVFSATFSVPAPKCSPDAEVKSKQWPRSLTKEEFEHGSPIYVVTSTPSRDASILSRQVDQGRDYQEVGRTPWIYNALAFNTEDNWLYAISQDRGGDPCYPGGNLLQIDPRTGDVYNLGPLLKDGGSGSPFASDGDKDVINAGVYTNEGFFIANTSTSGTRRLYKVDTDKVSVKPVFKDETLSYSEDWAVLPSDQRYMWGFQSKAKAGDKLIAERINTATGEIKTWDLTNIKTLDGRGISNPSASWGKAWTYSNGNLGFGTGSSNANQLGFELKITDAASNKPKFELVNVMNNLPSSYNTDAASDLVPPPPELQSNLAVKKLRSETKTVGNEVRTYWTITLENTTDNPSSGGSFFEYLPTDTHYGVNAKGPSARFEGFGDGSTKINGRLPGPDQVGSGKGIYAGMNVPSATEREVNYMHGYVGTIPGRAKVEYVVSSPVRTDKFGNLKAVCKPNRVGLQPTDAEANPADADNVATEACFTKVAVDSEPQPVENAKDEYTAKYNVVVSAPDAPGFDSNDVIYGKLIDAPKFVGAASVIDATVIFKDEFDKSSDPKKFSGSGPYELNANTEPKVIKPKGVEGSTGQHVYEVTVHFKLDATKLDNSSVPAGQSPQPAGNGRCYIKDGLHEPQFGLMNEVEMGGWKDTACIPLKNQKMNVFLEKVSYDPESPDKIKKDGLLEGAEFAVHRGDTDGKLQLKPDGSVNTDTNPLVEQSTTADRGRVQLKGLDAPGVYYLIETKAPQGYNLLPKPVKFSTAWNGDGAAVVKILSDGALTAAGNECDKSSNTNCDKKVGIIQIADVSKGELPKTGGAGVIPWVIAGATIILLGCVVLRRRKA